MVIYSPASCLWIGEVKWEFLESKVWVNAAPCVFLNERNFVLGSSPND